MAMWYVETPKGKPWALPRRKVLINQKNIMHCYCSTRYFFARSKDIRKSMAAGGGQDTQASSIS